MLYLDLPHAKLSRGQPQSAGERESRLQALRDTLQTAIELEHSTIPPYLYALYSIKDNANLEVATLIKSIVREEMLHMALDCNILNAIQGNPKIDNPRFIPTYPGRLPGSVEQGLCVPLAPLDKQLVHDVFMVIEEPKQTVDGEPTPPEGVTIGEFYAHIQRELEYLSKGGNIFTGNPRKQLVTGFAELQDRGVFDLRSANAAIELIVSQGEGSPTSPLDPEHELAHYYRYAEIYHGRKLIPNPERAQPKGPAWVYKGHPITFDPCGVYPVIRNPNSKSYQHEPRLQELNLAFNAAYTDLLRKLQRVFTGEPDWLGPALLVMQNLKAQAQLLMTLEVVPGQTAGPTFEYVRA